MAYLLNLVYLALLAAAMPWLVWRSIRQASRNRHGMPGLRPLRGNARKRWYNLVRYFAASSTHRPQSRGVSCASLGTSLVIAVALLLQ